ncbi:MAG TPA: hypothetical protein VGJ26_17765 [Pirellulales bacterium]|jgi:hypothetical protein
MRRNDRRQFLAEVGQGLMIATVGLGTAVDMGLAATPKEEPAARIDFGGRERLVGLMQDTPIERFQPALAEQLAAGVSLSELVAAAALANARTFGGEDYIGFHSFMALAPALAMSRQLPDVTKALPVFKVLYRNTGRMQAKGGSNSEVLHPLDPAVVKEAGQANPAHLDQQIRHAIAAKDLARAEALLAVAAGKSPIDAFNALLPTVEDGVEVHRTVLAYRAWDLLELVGRDQALTFLRQSLHYCNDACKPSYSDRFSGIRALLPKLMDQYRLVELTPGARAAEDGWIDTMSDSIFKATADQAADSVAAALAEGMSFEAVGEAISLSANQMVLRDAGRSARNADKNKPAGSVHGDSLGVHASDSVNAWRHIAQVSDRRNGVASLILAAWQVANDRQFGAVDMLTVGPRPTEEQMKKIDARSADALITALVDAIKTNDQERACAVTQLYGEQDFAIAPIQDVLLEHAIANDGALHAEKYYRTATEEFGRTRPKFRWRQMVSLARVTASENGKPAPGLDEAKRLLGA